MEKIKIVLWGITDSIWNDVKINLNWKRVEILAFIDQDTYIDGKIFEGVKIWNYSQLLLIEKKEFDYILIAAYSGYQQILKLLKNNGIPDYKIQLYISKGLKAYCFGEIENIDRSLVKEIYSEPAKKQEMLDEYNRDVKILEGLRSLERKKNKWYEQYSIIAHACGGYVNGKKVIYSNSREALDYSLKQGVKVIECDILQIRYNEVICAHDYYRSLDAEKFGYTIQTPKDIIEKLTDYPDVHLLIDFKWKNIDEYKYYLSYILDSIDLVSNNNFELKKQLKDQIILEVYEEETIKMALKEGFDVFFTQYKNLEFEDYKKVAILCLKYNIGIVGFGFNYIQSHSKLLSIFKQRGICVFGFSCDSITEYSEMRKKGLDGIFSNYIIEEV